MDKWKNELKQAFEAPQPVRKRNFLRHLDLPRMPVHEFLFAQIGYIRKWVWCVSTLIFVVSILGLAFLPGTVLWLISGLTPLLALTIISESGRSELYKMSDIRSRDTEPRRLPTSLVPSKPCKTPDFVILSE